MSDTKPTKKHSRSEWLRTPYAKSSAKDAEGSITKLLAKYCAASDVMLANYTGEQGRPAFGVRFTLNGRSYKVAFESLDTTPQVSDDERRTQVKRAVFHTLKALLETSTIFAPAEQVLFAFAEIPNSSRTIYDLASPVLNTLGPANIARMMLGPATNEGAPPQ